MKTLFIRFFDDKNNQIPIDSFPVDWKYSGVKFIIHNWLTMYPEGKVDFILV